MDVRLLGPVEVRDEGRRVPLNGAKPTAILAALVVHLGEVISVDRLVDLVWEERPPATARALVASHVSGLRRALAASGAAEVVRTRSPGYLVDLPPSRVDARRFEEALALGRRLTSRGRAAEAAEVLRDAMALWGGREALEGVGQSFARVEAARLAELRLTAQEERFAAELALGCRAELVSELLAHVAAAPLRERPRGQLMTALFRTGRVPDGLRVYEEGRELFRAELGIDPGPGLRALHQALLRADTDVLGAVSSGPVTAPVTAPVTGQGPVPAATPPPTPTSTSAPVTTSAPVPVGGGTGSAEPPRNGDIPGRPPVPVHGAERPWREAGHPDQPGQPGQPGHPGHRTGVAHPDRVDRAGRPAPCHLPPDVADFVGRAEQIAWTTALLDGVNDGSRTAPPIGVISGRSGVGKTALAVHAGHRASARFPDGQIFLDLRASDSAPLPTADALARLLRALGAGPEELSGDEDDLVGLYRTHMAHRKVLLVLDNAVGEAHLRPLLPSGSGSAVLITSRRRLVALEGASRLELTAPSRTEALDLLARVAGGGRADAEPVHAAEIVALCGQLPLAVRVAGARLAARPHWTPARLAARLRDERRRLDELQAGDLEVRASLGLGYADLDEQERRALRRLALMDLPDFPAWIAAPLLDITVDEAEESVERLVDCHFIEVTGADGTGRIRYRIHDLAREHARERCLSEESAEERDAAVLRLAGRWLAMAEVAASRGPGEAARLQVVARDGEPLEPHLREELLARPSAWFAAEQPCLLAAVKHCADHGLSRTARDLAAALVASSAAQYNQFDAWSRSHTVALDAVRRTGDVEGEAWLLHGLGELRLQQDRFEEAHAFFGEALVLFERTGVARGVADALAGMGSARREQARFDEALELMEGRALPLYRELGDATGEACQHYGIGVVHRDRGGYDDARRELSRAHRLFAAAGDRHGEALALRGLALCHRARGELAEAERLLGRALDLFEEAGDAFGAMYAGQSLAKVHIRQGRLPEARERLDRCLETTRERQDRFGQALVLRTLGECRLAAGAWDDAAGYLHTALSLWDELALPLWRARTLRDLGDAAAGRGERDAARARREEALKIFRALGSREADEVRTTDEVRTAEAAGVAETAGMAGAAENA
ncbi:AfsR/SARP family transcriptional regulator [Streptomyces beigongshangae]|uniref:AfsR/SARP family transcriptional regulator n=1 Tax=Streptomyces beigongshangae TaxID=2841597 RepID=UPI001C85C5C6|nr:BTAD domain-containing putative transcriptional regulator [Streptomyces sp. REN17]